MTETSRAKKIEELPVLAAIANDDLFIVHDKSSNTTKQANSVVVSKALFNGPFANDAVANTNGVEIGQPYYDEDGVLYIRLT